MRLEIGARARDKGGESSEPRCGGPMPSLFRFLVLIGVLAGIGYGAMLALAILVEPTPREMTVRIPSERMNP